MKFELLTPLQSPHAVEVLVFGLFRTPKTPAIAFRHPLIKSLYQWALKHLAPELNESLGHHVSSTVPTAQGTFKIILVQLGDAESFDLKKYKKVLQGLTSSFKTLQEKNILITLTGVPVLQASVQDLLMQTVVYCRQLHHRYEHFKMSAPKKPYFKHVTLWIAAKDLLKAETYVQQALAISEGIELCQYLGNLSPNICTPAYLAQTAQQLAKKHKSLKVDVLEPAQIKKIGMNCLLAVAQGSAQTPRFIVLNYAGGPAKQKPIALIGKGITFDSGGISLKAGLGMDEMKYDMCGAAGVLGTLQAVAQMKLPLNVMGFIAAAENMPSGTATRPGDVIHSLSGLSVEILNTDAEGRLILCDALTYAQRHHPAAMIDLATLTSAIITALGPYASGLFSNHDVLANDLIRAGEQTLDALWRMPVWPEHLDTLQSNFADLANIPDRAAAQSSVAAAFLSRFVDQNIPWAHLDIAGTAWQGGKDKSALGRPILALCQLLMHYSAHPPAFLTSKKR